MNEIINTVGEKAHLVTYTGAGTSVVGGLTLSDISVVVGIVVGICGLIIQLVFKILHYRLERKRARGEL